MNNKKLSILLYTIIIILGFVYYIVFIMIPDLKSTYGSSDHLFSYKRYDTMYEFLYDDGTNFSLVLDKDSVVYHIMFFDKNAICLYNQRIEGMDFREATNLVRQLVGEKSGLNVIYYGERLDKDKSIIDSLVNYNILYKKSTIKDKAISLGFNVNSDEEMLQDISYYSLEVIRKYKKLNTSEDNLENSNSNSNNYLNNSDYVYKKIEEYIETNNLTNLDIGNSYLLIQTIPASRDLDLFPSSNSWYYVKDSKVYAYIEFIDGNKKVGYCYSGGIDLKEEGECSK